MQNPLLTRWSGPFGGVPPFDRVNKLRASFSAWGEDLWALQDWYREA